MTDSTKEIIKFYTEWSKLFMVTLISVVAGIVALIRNKDISPTEYMLITIGIVTIFILTLSLAYLTIKILLILKNSRNGDL